MHLVCVRSSFSDSLTGNSRATWFCVGHLGNLGYDAVPGIALQWRLAAEQLLRARKVVIIGVSLAPSDARLSWLLQYGLNDARERVDVDLVYYNGGRRDIPIEQRAARLMPHAHIRRCRQGFEQYLRDEGILQDGTTPRR